MHKIRLDCVDSTNAYAKTHYRTFPKGEISCIVANEQTAGRGTFLKKWTSPPNVNLYITFHLQLPQNYPRLTEMALITSQNIKTVLTNLGLQPTLKHPNDVLLNGKKIAGVLCETEFHDGKVELFIGIGINVNLTAEQALQIDQPATSLLIETGHTWDREYLLELLQNQIEHTKN